MSETKQKCSSKRWDRSYGGRRPCDKPAKVERDGNLYCMIHDPERLHAQREERDQKRHEQAVRNNQRYDKLAAFEEISTAAIEAVNNIDAGDPWFPVIKAVRKWERLP